MFKQPGLHEAKQKCIHSIYSISYEKVCNVVIATGRWSIANMNSSNILNTSMIHFDEITHEKPFTLASIQTLTGMNMTEAINVSEKLSQRSTLIRYNETKPQVHLSDEMTYRFTLWCILSAEINLHKSTVCRGTLCSCGCRQTLPHALLTSPITLPESSKGPLITSFKIISVKNSS